MLPYDGLRAEALLGNLATGDAQLVRMLAALQGDAPARALTRASKLYREAGAVSHEPLLAVRARAELLTTEGQAVDARAVLDEALGALPPMSPDPAHVGLRIARVDVALRLGELQVARARIRSLHGDTRLKGQPVAWVRICQLMARTHLESGEWQAAERRLTEAENVWPSDPVSAPNLETALLRVRLLFLSAEPAMAAAALRRVEAWPPYQRFLSARDAASEIACLQARLAAVRAIQLWRTRDPVGLAGTREQLQDRLRVLRNAAPPPLLWLQVLSGVGELVGGDAEACRDRLERIVLRAGDPIARAAAAHLLSQTRSDEELAQQDLRHAVALLRDVGSVPSPEAVALGAAVR